MSDGDFERSGNGDDDNDFDYDTGKKGGKGEDLDGKTQPIQNHHYDEAVDVSDGGSEIQSDPDPEPQAEEEEEPERDEEAEDSPSPPPQKQNKPTGKFQPIQHDKADEEEDNGEALTAGQYDPSEYLSLNVGQEVKDLFKYITRFKPTSVNLDTKLRPFIPDYIPAVGEVDAFLKPSRPDNQTETLGLLTVDEPSLNQSKESTIRLMINALSRKKVDTKRVVDSIENAEKNPKEINKWIHDVSSIQRQPPSVVYSKPFPDIDNLMQVWPQEIEDALQGFKLPTEELDVNLEEYAKLCCGLVDIPVHQNNSGKNVVESLHVFFTLYAEFKANQHFQQGNEQFVYEGNM